MTTDLEKQFFDTFGVEPKPLFSTRNGYTDDAYYYPQITDHILLELICIEKQLHSINFNYEDFKCEILNHLIGMSKSNAFPELAKQQIQALFKE